MFEQGTDEPSRILVAVDGSEESLRAGAYAAGMARRQGARLVVVYVRQISGLISSVPTAVGAAIQMHAAIVEDLRRQAEREQKRLGVEITIVERTGDPYTEITHVAEELQVDAVVVGSSTHAGRRRVGSLVGKLVKGARWPIIVVP